MVYFFPCPFSPTFNSQLCVLHLCMFCMPPNLGISSSKRVIATGVFFLPTTFSHPPFASISSGQCSVGGPIVHLPDLWGPTKAFFSPQIPQRCLPPLQTPPTGHALGDPPPQLQHNSTFLPPRTPALFFPRTAQGSLRSPTPLVGPPFLNNVSCCFFVYLFYLTLMNFSSLVKLRSFISH